MSTKWEAPQVKALLSCKFATETLEKKIKRRRFKIGLKQSLCFLHATSAESKRVARPQNHLPLVTMTLPADDVLLLVALKKNCPTLCWETDNNELLAAVEDVKQLLHSYCCLDVSLHSQSSGKNINLENFVSLSVSLRVALTWLFLAVKSGHNANNMIRCQLLCNRIGLTNDACWSDCHWNSYYDSTHSIVVWCLEM